MKKQILIFLIILFTIYTYGKNITVKHTAENVTVYVSSFSYREELNKGIIIGEYVKELSKRYNYHDSIEISLQMVPDEKPKYFFRDKKNIFLQFYGKEFNLLDNLKLIELAILKKNKITKEINYNQILESKSSVKINEVLKISLERPNIIKQLIGNSDYTYRYQDNKYHIYNIKTNESLFVTDYVYLFTTIAYTRPLIFINNHEFYYKNLNGDLKFISFKNGNKLSENFIMKELDYFIIFNILQNGDSSVAILNLKKDKLIDNLEW